MPENRLPFDFLRDLQVFAPFGEPQEAPEAQPDMEAQRQRNRDRAAQQRARDEERRRNAAFQPTAVDQAMAVAPAIVAQQGKILSDAAEKATDAIGDEMRSRVSQLREMRRMEHEKEIEQIRAQAALERVRQARKADDMSRGILDGMLGDGLVDMTGTARRIG